MDIELKGLLKKRTNVDTDTNAGSRRQELGVIRHARYRHVSPGELRDAARRLFSVSARSGTAGWAVNVCVGWPPLGRY